MTQFFELRFTLDLKRQIFVNMSFEDSKLQTPYQMVFISKRFVVRIN